MIESFLFGNRTLDELRAGLDASSLRHRVVASNIANVNTPGFQPKGVRFEELLEEAAGAGRNTGPGAEGNRSASALARTNDAHMGSSADAVPQAQVVSRPGAEVELEQEMVELQQNAIHYRALSQFVARRYRGLMDAIGSQG